MTQQRNLDTSEYKNSIYHDPQRYDDEYWWKTNDIEFWKEILKESTGKNVLELAAGTARIGIPLIREGAKYTGVDISPEFCKQAKKKIKSHQLNANFITADIRSLKLNKKFDLIFIGFNSFLHLLKDDDALACLNSVKKHMHQNTLFVIDIFVPNPLFLYRPETKFPLMEYKDSTTGEIVSIDEISIYNPETEINSITWYYNTPAKKNDVIYSFAMRMYFPDTMNRLIIDSGLKIQKVLGSHKHEKFNEESELQIYICSL